MKNKFYGVTVEEKYGEWEVQQSLLLRLPEDEDPDKYMRYYNLDWYGQECTKADEDYDGWINNDIMKHRAGDWAEISEECFNELAATKVVYAVGGTI